MSSHTTAIVEELAKDYASYAKLDLSNQMMFFVVFLISHDTPKCTVLFKQQCANTFLLYEICFTKQKRFFIPYHNYLCLNRKRAFMLQMKGFHDTIEDVMMRLEEFQSIIEMVQNERTQCIDQHIPKLQDIQPEVVTLCKRIDALEHVIAMANVNLTTLEAAVDNAEADLGISDRLFGMLNPLSFFKKSQEPSIPNKLPVYEQPTIYRTNDYFNGE